MEIKGLCILLFCWLYACRGIIESSWPERKGQEVVDDVLASIGRRAFIICEFSVFKLDDSFPEWGCIMSNVDGVVWTVEVVPMIPAFLFSVDGAAKGKSVLESVGVLCAMIMGNA